MKLNDFKCPICGKYEFEEREIYDVCPICLWEDDPLQAYEPDLTGANPITLNEAREQYKKYGRITWEHNGKPIQSTYKG